MSEEIINRVANSNLITIDLADYAPTKIIIEIDLKQFLFEEFVLKEKEFRNLLKDFDFSIYKNKLVGLYCSSGAVIPLWAYMLITSYLNNVSFEIYFGTKEEVFHKCFLQNIDKIDIEEFKEKKVVIKGCGRTPINEDLYIAITKKLQNTVSSLMFGEACSAVPVFKKK